MLQTFAYTGANFKSSLSLNLNVISSGKLFPVLDDVAQSTENPNAGMTQFNPVFFFYFTARRSHNRQRWRANPQDQIGQWRRHNHRSAAAWQQRPHHHHQWHARSDTDGSVPLATKVNNTNAEHCIAKRQCFAASFFLFMHLFLLFLLDFSLRCYFRFSSLLCDNEKMRCSLILGYFVYGCI